MEKNGVRWVVILERLGQSSKLRRRTKKPGRWPANKLKLSLPAKAEVSLRGVNIDVVGLPVGIQRSLAHPPSHRFEGIACSLKLSRLAPRADPDLLRLVDGAQKQSHDGDDECRGHEDFDEGESFSARSGNCVRNSFHRTGGYLG
jgi:hypothetical protein